jgi:hypothetical protein
MKVTFILLRSIFAFNFSRLEMARNHSRSQEHNYSTQIIYAIEWVCVQDARLSHMNAHVNAM